MTIPGVTKRSTASEMEQREAMMRERAEDTQNVRWRPDDDPRADDQ